jgi:hypothetical protein
MRVERSVIGARATTDGSGRAEGAESVGFGCHGHTFAPFCSAMVPKFGIGFSRREVKAVSPCELF